ncbi:MAG: lysylphosphatidylglycerol synthase transmembrane domain-containing protein [Bacteroidia bacterium]
MNRPLMFRRILYWAFWLLGIALFYLAFRHIPFSDLKQEISTLRPVYLLLLLIPSWGGQFLRSWRWRLLLGKETPFFRVYHSLLFGYFVNLALPRVGEISRCAALQSTGGPSFGKALGTVIVERIADLAFLVIVVFIAFYLQGDIWRTWFVERVGKPLNELYSQNQMLVLGILFGGLFSLFVLFRLSGRWFSRLGAKATLWMDQLKQGIASIFSLNLLDLLLFVLLSAAIWTCYFFTTWLWFLALPAADGASLGVAFTVMVTGSLVKTLPIQGGGAGAYHLVIGELLVLFGLGSLSSRTFALLNHGYQTVFYLLFGGFSALWIAWQKRKFAKEV